MSGSEPHFQALRTFSSRSAAASRNDSRSGYGGISEKISRLNDILSSLEDKRGTNADRYESPDNGYPTSTWPPALYNSSRLWDTKTLLGRPEAGEKSVLNRLTRDGDERNDTLPSHGEGWDMQHRGSVLRTLRARQAPCGMVDTLAGRHPQSVSPCIGIHNMRRRPSTAGDVLHMLPGQHAGRGSMLSTPDGICAVPSFYGCSSDDYVGYNHLCHPSSSVYHSARHRPQPQLDERSESNCKLADARMSQYFGRPDTVHPGSPLNVEDIAHAILARLERLELQQQSTTLKLPNKLNRLAKKGKVGVDQKVSRQIRKGNFGEKGLLQLVRRRVKGGMPHACESQYTNSRGKEDQEIEKRLQRIENEIELCWSAINQLCIDNEHFREDRQRSTQRTGQPLHQLNENNIHVKATHNTLKSKVSYKTKRRGVKTKYVEDSKLQENDSSTQ